MTILGLDIGGANIKAADDSGHANSRSFAIWRDRDRLNDEIAGILAEFPQTKQIALTMTAELADCFSTKSEGVCFILDAVEACMDRFQPHRQHAGSLPEPRDLAPVVVWSTDGRFFCPQQARDAITKVAAANWHALATWCGTLAPKGSGLLVDIGTTTTDMIPLLDGHPIPIGLTDVARLQSGELSYSGVWRTPLCAVAHSVPFRDGYCSLAAELFATTLDINLLLDHIDEDEQNFETANGKPATKSAAHDRIARMLCGDRFEVSSEDAVQIARFLADVQRQRLAGALDRVLLRLPSRCESVIISGSGSFLARQLISENRRTAGVRTINVADHFSPRIASSACAYAVARLAIVSR